MIPSPQIAGSGVNYTAVLPGRYDEDQFNTNFDQMLSKTDQLSGEILLVELGSNAYRSPAPPFPGFPALRNFANRNLAIAQTHIFSPNAVNQFRAGFSRIAGRNALLRIAHGSSRGDYPCQRPAGEKPSEHSGSWRFPAWATANEDKSQTANNHFYFSDIVSLARGKHNLRLGTEIFRNQYNESPDHTDGSLTFLSFPDFLLGLPGGPVSAGGNGTPTIQCLLRAGQRHDPSYRTALHRSPFFRGRRLEVLPGLTINLGIRLEVNGQQSEANGRMSNFDPGIVCSTAARWIYESRHIWICPGG